MKMKGLNFFRIIIILVFFASCNSSKKNISEYVKIYGFAQGTTWHITYQSKDGENLTNQIDSILKVFDFSMSAYNKQSQLTKINNNEDVKVDSFFIDIFNESKALYDMSGKMFDPTVRPLVKAWGFGHDTQLQKPSPQTIDSILLFTGLDKVKIIDGKIVKSDQRTTLIFNANAQGYSVDLICQWFLEQGYSDFLVEVGGETRAFGVNSNGTPWRVGIDAPVDGSSEIDRVIWGVSDLSDGMSLCTSGNYRNFFYTEDGRRYSHELNPVTGYPTQDSVLSVAIIASNAMRADGLATVAMVLGVENGFKLIDSLPNTEGLFFYSESNGDIKTIKTKGFVIEKIQKD